MVAARLSSLPKLGVPRDLRQAQGGQFLVLLEGEISGRRAGDPEVAADAARQSSKGERLMGSRTQVPPPQAPSEWCAARNSPPKRERRKARLGTRQRGGARWAGQVRAEGRVSNITVTPW